MKRALLLLSTVITFGLSTIFADVTYKGFTISDAITHNNLSLFLISGEESLKGKKIITLAQAMEKKSLIVHETGSVNQLQVENRSGTEYVFIQSGDIVKGGKQDRTLQHSMLVPPKSGKVDVASFCVEQGRWQKRGSEDVTKFSGSNNRVVSKELKLAARSKKSQQQVWSEVSNYQRKLQKKMGNDTLTNRSSARLPNEQRQQVQRQESDINYLSNVLPIQNRGGSNANTSLQLTIESKEFQKEVTAYQKAIAQKLPKLDGVVGFAFAINGEINSADIYASYDLFLQLWPKVLESTIMEAVVTEGSTAVTEVSPNDIVAWFHSIESANVKSEEINQSSEQQVKESESDVLYEAVIKGEKREWIHKNYIKK